MSNTSKAKRFSQEEGMTMLLTANKFLENLKGERMNLEVKKTDLDTQIKLLEMIVEQLGEDYGLE